MECAQIKTHKISFTITDIVNVELRSNILKKCGFKTYEKYLLFKSKKYNEENTERECHQLGDLSIVNLKFDISNKMLFNIHQLPEEVNEKCKKNGLKMFTLPFNQFDLDKNSSIFLDNKNEWYSILSLLNLTQNNQVQLYVYVNTKKKSRKNEYKLVEEETQLSSNETEPEVSENIEENDIIKKLKSKYNFELKYNVATCNSYILSIYRKTDGMQLLSNEDVLSKDEQETIQHILNSYDYRDIYWSHEYNGYILGTKMCDIVENIFIN
jgi:hypothetical protein